jgi:hypothetical protein
MGLTVTGGMTFSGGLIITKKPFANTTYSTPGTYSLFVPAGTYVDIRGARGGYAAAKVSAPGYGGRLVVQTLSDQTFQIVVGANGGNGTSGGRNAGGGGGYSGIFISSVTQANYIAVAGGGGGCATGNPSEDKPGGNGAGNGTGSNGGTFSGSDFGVGGTTSAGGAGGTTGGAAGSALQGGGGANQGGGTGGSNGGTGGNPGGGAAGGIGSGDGAGGGGGGGYYGGGGGGASTWGGGGGGGSGNYNATYCTLVRASSGYNNGAGSISFLDSDPG